MTTPSDPNTPQDDAPLDAKTTALLATRFKSFEAGAEHPEMELVARYAAGDVTEAEADRVREILALEPELAEATARLMDMEGEQKVVSLGARRGTAVQRAATRSRAAAPRAWWGAVAAAIIAAVGIGVFVTRDAGPDDTGGSTDMGAGIGAGSNTDQLLITVARDGDPVVVGTGSALPSGAETMTVHFTAPTQGHVAVVRYDLGGSLAPIVDDRGKGSREVTADTTDRVDVRVGTAPGAQCAWVVAVFADRPFTMVQLRTGLSKATIDADTCVIEGLEAALPFARTTRTVVINTP